MDEHGGQAKSVGPPESQAWVVCVDDEPGILHAVERLLRCEPYRLYTTTTPKDALNWILQHDVKVAIADYRMPDVSGIEFLKVVRAGSPRTRRILLTGFREDTAIVQSLREGLMHVLVKPWNGDELKRLILEGVAASPNPAPSLDTPRP